VFCPSPFCACSMIVYVMHDSVESLLLD